MKKLIVILALIFSFSISLALDIPTNDWYILDQTSTLTVEQEQTLETKIYETRKSTDMEIWILIINSLEWEDIFTYSLDVAEAWWVGDKEKDNGLFILFAMEDRERRIQVWYWLEWVITDNIAKRIWDKNIAVNFREWLYFDWINNTLQDIIDYVNQDPAILEYINAEDNYSDSWSWRNLEWLFWVYIMAMFFAARKLIIKKESKGTGKNKKQKVKIWKKWRINYGILWVLWSIITYFILLPGEIIWSGMVGFWWLLVIMAILSATPWWKWGGWMFFWPMGWFWSSSWGIWGWSSFWWFGWGGFGGWGGWWRR